ncbi:hypothetical protein F4680DRAFT_449785 [Xylaria scruposa]|nr:hypothetical protein F4680DRAFT_449785 [Xylaria scruposa]
MLLRPRYSGSSNKRVTVWVIATSRVSPEAVLIVFFVGGWLCDENGNRFTVGIVTPYEAQAKLLEDKIKGLSPAEVNHDLIDIRTVNGRQGHER